MIEIKDMIKSWETFENDIRKLENWVKGKWVIVCNKETPITIKVIFGFCIAAPLAFFFVWLAVKA